jgi:hypothetical protein
MKLAVKQVVFLELPEQRLSRFPLSKDPKNNNRHQKINELLQ